MRLIAVLGLLQKRTTRRLLISNNNINSFSTAAGEGRSGGRSDTDDLLSTAAPLIDYYKALGVKREASLDEIKTAFREMAKVHHPDVVGEGTTESLATFKLINEAYSILGNTSLRKEYDAKAGNLPGRGSVGGGMSLRARNEGIYGGIIEVKRPASAYEAGPEWMSGKSDAPGSRATDLTGFDSTSPNTFSASDNMDAFRASMTRATEKAKDNARYRASLARINRTRISVPSTSDSSWGMLAAPIAVVGMWLCGVFLYR
jgi:curved DNA-binding protein CbpA